MNKQTTFGSIYIFLLLCLSTIFACNNDKNIQTENKHSAIDGTGTLVQASVFPPRRIVSTSPETTELLFFIGAGDRVIAVSNQCNYPPQVKNLPKIGGYSYFSPESIAILKPDLVVATINGNPKDSIEWLKKHGISVFTTKATNLLDIPKNLKALSRIIFSNPQKLKTAQKKADDLNNKFVSMLKNKQSKNISAVALVEPSSIFVAGSNTLIDNIITAAGFVNKAAKNNMNSTIGVGNGYFQLSPEVLMNMQVDVVFLLQREGKPTRDRSIDIKRIWRDKTPKICYLPEDESARATPRVMVAIEAAKKCAKSFKKNNNK